MVHEDSADKFSVAENVPTERGARTMALDPAKQRIFLVTAEFDRPPPRLPDNRIRGRNFADSFEVLVVSK